MRIACLQFDPQVGDIDNNLSRADAVLGRVDSGELDGLDLLVLPELAFTGQCSAQVVLILAALTGSVIYRLQLQVPPAHRSVAGRS